MIHAAFSPDGRRIVTASAGPDGAGLGRGHRAARSHRPMKHQDGVVPRRVQPRRPTRRHRQRLTRRRGSGTRPLGQPATPPMKHEAAVEHAAFSPDGRRVVTGQ